MTEHMLKEIFERRLAEVELNFERSFRCLHDAHESRLAALEAEVKSAHEKVALLQEDATTAMVETYHLLSDADKEQRDMIDAISFNIDEMEDRLGAVFDKAFPNHSRYCAAMLDVIEKKRGGGL